MKRLASLRNSSPSKPNQQSSASLQRKTDAGKLKKRFAWLPGDEDALAEMASSCNSTEELLRKAARQGSSRHADRLRELLHKHHGLLEDVEKYDEANASGRITELSASAENLREVTEASSTQEGLEEDVSLNKELIQELSSEITIPLSSIQLGCAVGDTAVGWGALF
jgi:hypothetical protein